MEPRNRRVALVIGVSHYEHHGKLDYCIPSARDVFEMLTNPKLGRCEPAPISQLIVADETTKISVTELDALIRETISELQLGDQLIFYFCGHGFASRDGFFLLLPDTVQLKNKQFFITSYDFTSLARNLKHGKVNKAILIVDTCYSAAMFKAMQHSMNVAEWSPDDLPDGIICLASTDELYESFQKPELQRTLFSHYLCRGLQDWSNFKSPVITPVEIKDYINSQIDLHYPEEPQRVQLWAREGNERVWLSMNPSHKETEAQSLSPDYDLLDPVDWLRSRNIVVSNYEDRSPADHIYDRLAVFLGDRFESLDKLYTQIKRNISSGKRFQLNMNHSSKEEIANSTQFCSMLNTYAFLTTYDYRNKTIYATPQNLGSVINFFNGGWFTRYVFLKIKALLDRNNLRYKYLLNSQVELPGWNNFELDLFFIIDGQQIWIECRTGNYQSYINRFSSIRSVLAIPKESAIMVMIGMPEHLTQELSQLYGVTFGNESSFLNKVAYAIGIENTEYSVQTNTSVSLSTSTTLLNFLNKRGLRPLPEVRKIVLREFIDIVQAADEAITLSDMKSLIFLNLNSKSTSISKSKLQDILNAILRSEILLDDAGVAVKSAMIPFNALVAYDIKALEQRCIECYMKSILIDSPDYFQSTKNISEFEETVGCVIEDIEIIGKLSKELNSTV